MINVLQLISSQGYFGAENMVVQLAGELHKRGDCNVVAGVIENLATPHVEVAEESEKRGVRSMIFPCRGKLDTRTILAIRSFCQEEKVDLIHSHGYKANLYAFFATRSLGNIGLVATCHNWLGDDPKMKLFAAADRFFLRYFSAVAAVSEELKRKIINAGIEAEKVHVQNNGIDLERFGVAPGTREEVRAALGIPESAVVIGTVGRISAEKGHVHLLNTTAELINRHPQTFFLIVGDGELRQQLEKEWGGSRVIFTGYRSDLPQLYSCMDIFALPSLTEGLPLVLLEAMAAGLPVVASRVGSVPDLVVDGDSGLLVEPADDTALHRSLLHLLNDPETRKTMGANARGRVMAGYSAATMAAGYQALYSAALGHRSPQARCRLSGSGGPVRKGHAAPRHP